MRTKPENLVLWEQRIKERNQSGMSIAAWCKKNKISKNMYHYWNQRISKVTQMGKEPEFAEVSSIISNTYTTEAEESKSDDFQIFFNNVQATVPSNFNQDSLAG